MPGEVGRREFIGSLLGALVVRPEECPYEPEEVSVTFEVFDSDNLAREDCIARNTCMLDKRFGLSNFIPEGWEAP